MQASAGVERHTCSHGFRIGKAVTELAVDVAGIGSSGCVLRFESVEFLEDFDGNPDVIVLEVQHRERVMDEDIGIEHEIFDGGGS